MGKRIVSKQGSLQGRDLFRGLIMAILTPAVLVLQQSLDAGILVFNLKAMGMASIAGGLAYLVKNLLEPTKVIEIKKKEIEEVHIGI